MAAVKEALADRQVEPSPPGGPHVYRAIAAVMAALSREGITKNRRNSQGSGYDFRGVDDVYNALSGLLADNDLCIIPRVLSREAVERTSAKGAHLIYTAVDVEFDLVSAIDGSKHTARTAGEAMDSGDKSTNKAMSAAYKYMAFQTFCIPTEADNDSENDTYELGAERREPPRDERPKDSQAVAVAKLAIDGCYDTGDLKRWLAANRAELDKLPAADFDKVVDYYNAAKAKAPAPQSTRQMENA